MAELFFFNCQPYSLAYQKDYELLTKRIFSRCKVTWSKKGNQCNIALIEKKEGTCIIISIDDKKHLRKFIIFYFKSVSKTGNGRKLQQQKGLYEKPTAKVVVNVESFPWWPGTRKWLPMSPMLLKIVLENLPRIRAWQEEEIKDS